MRYSIEVVRSFYNDKAVMEQKQQYERFFDSISTAALSYDTTIIGERVTGEAHSYTGSSNITVSIYAYTEEGMIMLETTFLHNGEVQ